MRGQVGSWDECLALTLADDALAWLDTFGVDRRVLISVGPDRSITVLPDPSGHRVCFRGMRNAVLHGVTLDWRLVQGSPLPRFELFELSFEPTDGIAVELSLPADHLLPWPKLRDCASYSAAEVAMAELERRMMSAARAFGSLTKPCHWNWVYPPDEIKDLLPKGFWSEALRRAIALSTS